MGYVTSRRFDDGSSLDAAFVQTNPGYAMTNKVMGSLGASLVAGYLNPVVGTTVNKAGATTGLTSGYIISSNTSANYDGKIITDLYEADYLSASGDSGGVVYTSDWPVGIHVAGPAYGGEGSRYFVKASRIDTGMAAYPY
jgi:streptogrisin B